MSGASLVHVPQFAQRSHWVCVGETDEIRDQQRWAVKLGRTRPVRQHNVADLFDCRVELPAFDVVLALLD